jgi:hypothetical protein
MDLRGFVSLVLPLLAVGALFLTYMRHRRRAVSESEKRIGQARRRRFTEIAQERRSGLPRRSRDRLQTGMGEIVADEVDPLGEAEACLTLGRDREAESVLKDAIAQDPMRYELKLKLLAIYHERRDASAFDPLAEELYAALRGRHDELFHRLEAMGRCLNPHNRAPRADPWSVGIPSEELPPESKFESEACRRRHLDLTALALAETYLDLNETQRALGLLDGALSHHSGPRTSSVTLKPWPRVAADDRRTGAATEEGAFTTKDRKWVERRQRSRRTIGHDSDATSWYPNAFNRRRTLGRRGEDRL